MYDYKNPIYVKKMITQLLCIFYVNNFFYRFHIDYIMQNLALYVNIILMETQRENGYYLYEFMICI